MQSDYGDFPKVQISFIRQKKLKKAQTYLEGAVESGDFGNFVLNHFASIQGDFVFGESAAATVVFGCINLHFSETIVSERVATDHTALAGELAAAF